MPANPAIEEFERRVDDALLKASLTPEEAAALRVLDPTPAVVPPKAKVLRFARGRTSKEDLLAGADALDVLK